MHQKRPPPHFLLIVFLLLTACSAVKPEQETFDILGLGEPVNLALTQSLSIHQRFEQGLSTQSIDGVNMKTIETVDLKGKPFVNVTFIAPRPVSDIWSFAATLKGDEWSYDDFRTPWATVITGATTVRDVLVTSNEGLNLLIQMYKTIQTMGGVNKLKEVVAYDLQNFALRDTQNRLWSVDEARLFTAEESDYLEELYDSIYRANNNSEAAEMYQEMWRKTLADAETQQERFGYELSSLANKDGSLNLSKLQVAAAKTKAAVSLSPQTITEGSKDCFLFVCAAYQVGQLGNKPYQYGGLQASQGGSNQGKGFYYSGQPRYGTGSGFNTIACVSNTYQYDKPLGCAPSAFIGLVGRKFNNGATIDGVNKSKPFSVLQQKMLRPTPGYNNRPAIASYMGTCFFGGGGLTVGTRFKTGGDQYLLDAKAKSPSGKQLRLYGNVSRVTDNVSTADIKANILMQRVGRDNNPVVAEYFLGDRFKVGSEGHFAPVAQYAVKQGAAGTFVDIKTPDHKSTGRWYSLSGGWGTERGVYFID